MRRLEADGRLHQETRTFGAMTPDLLEMADWLAAAVMTHVALEATASIGSPFTILLRTAYLAVGE